MGVLEEQSGTSTPYLCGGSYYTNPINIKVVAPPLQPDVYEADNTVATAHTFPLSFSGNYASFNTTGSNVHIGSDMDYYKVDLPAGYFYTFDSRIDNANYTGNGQSYTLDALASYSTDGGNSWSPAYNGLISQFTVQGGRSVYFVAASYFQGETGTYLLEANITKSLTAVEDLPADAIRMYPNPATNLVTITSEGQAMTLDIFDITGKEILSRQMSGTINTIDVSQMTKGLYIVKVQQGEKSSCQKLVIN